MEVRRGFASTFNEIDPGFGWALPLGARIAFPTSEASLAVEGGLTVIEGLGEGGRLRRGGARGGG